MKKFTHLTTLILLILTFSFGFSQKVAVIGMNHLSPDGLTFVALVNIASSEVIYFSEDEYNNTTDLFSSGESVVQFTATSPIMKGDVVFIKEISTNTFSVNCTSGVCGNALEVSPTGNFALGSSGEQIYAYEDSDTDPTNGVIEIYSVMYTIPGSIPAGEDPTVDHPNAYVVDGFASGAPSRTEYMFSPATLRDNVGKTEIEDPSNYVNGLANADLSVVPFSNLLLGIDTVEFDLKIFPNPTSDYINIESNKIFDSIELLDIDGRFIMRSKMATQLDISTLPKGMYFLKLQDAGRVTIKKLIKN